MKHQSFNVYCKVTVDGILKESEIWEFQDKSIGYFTSGEANRYITELFQKQYQGKRVTVTTSKPEPMF